MSQPTLIISLDFELFWGMQDVVSLEAYKDNILGVRKAIPMMLEMFRNKGIHATWAAVGYLFGDNSEDTAKYFPELRPGYKNEKLSTYACFDNIGKGEHTEDCYYAYDLIKAISLVPGQEIGSHTFSHYYCREEGQTVEQFAADMKAAKAIAAAKGFDLKSVVFPRNQSLPEYTRVLSELGFVAYRDEENDWIHEKIRFKPLLRALRLLDVYLPLTGQCCHEPKIEDGIVNLIGSRMYKPFFRPLAFMERLKLNRIKKQMKYAAKNGKVFHLWWHPHNVGIHNELHMKQLEEIIEYYEALRSKYGMRSLNMYEAAAEALNG